jgi:hypothetical protein
VTTNRGHEEERLAGAVTSEEEDAGIDQVLVILADGTLELETAIAPAGDVRLTVMNRGSSALGFAMTAPEDNDRRGVEEDPAVMASWSSIEPGGSSTAVVHLEAGDYTLTSQDIEGERVLGSATLVVQPAEGLADAARRRDLGPREVDA